MPLILYSTALSPPVRAVLMTAEALGVELELREIDLAKQDHLKLEFQKINPQHTIPVLDDNGSIIWDSHAIVAYLVGKYGKNDELYPKDLLKRAIVDQRLHFDTGVAFSALRSTVRSLFYKSLKAIADEQKELIVETYDFLNKFLENQKWMAGTPNPTVADICLLATVSSLDTMIPVDPKFSNVTRWLKQAETLPYYAVNKPGLQIYADLIKSLIQK